MEFLSADVQKCFSTSQGVSFDEARSELLNLLEKDITAETRVEALSLLLHINAERDENVELEKIFPQALETIEPAQKMERSPALYHLGVVFLLCEDPDTSRECFEDYLTLSGSSKHFGQYGLAAVAYTQQESEKALSILGPLEEDQKEPTTDFLCLVRILRGNCLRSLARFEEAREAYISAQKALPFARCFYLKNWVFFGLGSIHARLGDPHTARILLEIVTSITHPNDFRRLYKLASDELARLEMSVEVLFNPTTGDLVSQRGVLSLRRKPTLISIFSTLVSSWPKPLSKESLYCSVWGGEYHPLRHDGLIYSHIQRLRHILSADKKLNDFLITTQDGYRLNPDITIRLKRSVKESGYES